LSVDPVDVIKLQGDDFPGAQAQAGQQK